MLCRLAAPAVISLAIQMSGRPPADAFHIDIGISGIDVRQGFFRYNGMSLEINVISSYATTLNFGHADVDIRT